MDVTMVNHCYYHSHDNHDAYHDHHGYMRVMTDADVVDYEDFPIWHSGQILLSNPPYNLPRQSLKGS
ncbi:hypothetical protein POVWA2_011660 [Plasmodium ovale wallikeri]|nr:hypothetical protein POVWA2_011660 [Plasmodium ovale wallikeri]SBT44670.1 hypothetical protein POVWA1_050300 [Plasmodium ovale wallikeri]